MGILGVRFLTPALRFITTAIPSLGAFLPTFKVSNFRKSSNISQVAFIFREPISWKIENFKIFSL